MIRYRDVYLDRIEKRKNIVENSGLVFTDRNVKKRKWNLFNAGIRNWCLNNLFFTLLILSRLLISFPS